MKYDLSIKQENIQPHLDIEKEIQLKQDGLFTFVIRVNSGNIVDLSILENINVKREYLTTIIVQKFPVSSYSGKRSQSNPIRPDNLQCGSQEGDSPTGES